MPKEGGGGRSSGGGGRKGRERFNGGGGGPMSPEAAEKMMQQLGVHTVNLAMMKADGTLGEVGAMMPPGTKLLGQGMQAVAFRLPDGTVMRVQNMVPVVRPNVSVVTQPISVTKIGNTTVERLPYVTPATSMSNAQQLEGRAFLESHMPAGHYGEDLHTGNYGKTASGQWQAFDPGAIQPKVAGFTYK